MGLGLRNCECSVCIHMLVQNNREYRLSHPINNRDMSYFLGVCKLKERPTPSRACVLCMSSHLRSAHAGVTLNFATNLGLSLFVNVLWLKDLARHFYWMQTFSDLLSRRNHHSSVFRPSRWPNLERLANRDEEISRKVEVIFKMYYNYSDNYVIQSKFETRTN